MTSRHLWAFCLTCVALWVTPATAAQLQNPQTLVNMLRRDGYVLYLRHAASDRTQTGASLYEAFQPDEARIKLKRLYQLY